MSFGGAFGLLAIGTDVLAASVLINALGQMSCKHCGAPLESNDHAARHLRAKHADKIPVRKKSRSGSPEFDAMSKAMFG